MAEKKWNDYWKKYKNEFQVPKDTYKPKIKPESSVKFSQKTPKPKLTAKSSNGFNLTAFFMVVLFLGILGLGYFQFKSAKTIEVLENEKFEYQCKLGNCTEQLENMNSSLKSCDLSLKSCNEDLTKNIGNLNLRTKDKESIDKSYKTCKDDLIQSRRDYQNVKSDYDDCIKALDKKGDDFNSCSSNLNALKTNYQNLCSTYCNQTCTFDSSTNRFICPTTTTTTTTAPTTTTTT